MTDRSVKRREFLKTVGIGAAAVAAGVTVPKIIAKTANGYVVKSESEYGGFLVEKMTNGTFPYTVKPDILNAMSNKMTVFSRDGWDPVRAKRPRENITKRNLVEGRGVVPNQTRLDYALMAASWTFARGPYPSYKWDTQPGMVSGMGLDEMGPWNPKDLNMDWKDASFAVKHAALFYGASLTGVAELNPLWIYSDSYKPKKEDRQHSIPVIFDKERFEQTEEAWYIPRSMNRVIALAFEEDYDGISNSPGRLASAAVGDGYSRMAITSFTLAQFIRALGYRAIPAGNGVGLSIPIAIDAGLGELGRNGLLITPKYGPRVRIAKVITDMPLIPDPPISFGVKEFCENCMTCAVDCPSGSIPKGHQTWAGKSPSNNPGVKKWYIQPEPCNDYNGFSCSNCKRNCPFNKPNNSWLHKMIRTVIKARVGALDKVMVSFDQASGYGTQIQGEEFWKKSGEKCITAREKM